MGVWLGRVEREVEEEEERRSVALEGRREPRREVGERVLEPAMML